MKSRTRYVAIWAFMIVLLMVICLSGKTTAASSHQHRFSQKSTNDPNEPNSWEVRIWGEAIEWKSVEVPYDKTYLLVKIEKHEGLLPPNLVQIKVVTHADYGGYGNCNSGQIESGILPGNKIVAFGKQSADVPSEMHVCWDDIYYLKRDNAAPTPPPPPSNLQASDGTYTDKVRVTWNSVSGATYYEVYRAIAINGPKTKLGSPSGTSFDDTSADIGSTYYYYYWVKGCNASGCSDFSNYDKGYKGGFPPPRPGGMTASDGKYTDKVRVSWFDVFAASYYEVYRATSPDNLKTKIGSPTGIIFDDTTAVVEQIYYYWVKACNNYGCSNFLGYETGYRGNNQASTSTPTRTPTPTRTLTPTNTPRPTATNTPRPTATKTPQPTTTNTPRPTATNTSRPTATNTPRPTATNTPRPTATNTPRPSATNTSRPTATNTPRPTATNTPRPTPTGTPRPEGSFIISGWVAQNAYDLGRESYININHTDLVSLISPAWYLLQEGANGQVKVLTYENVADNTIVTAANRTGAMLIPIIQVQDNNRKDLGLMIVETMLDNDYRAHADWLVKQATDNGYDGIEIDYENIDGGYREKFTRFVQYLAQKLHAANKLLVVTVQPKSSRFYNPAQDYSAIAAAADFVKVMIYDNHWDDNSGEHHATIPWINRVLDYALREIPSNKLIMGIPFYGYEWTRLNDHSWDFDEAGLTYPTAEALRQEKRAITQRTSQTNGLIPFYEYANQEQTVRQFFEDAISTGEKLLLARDRGLRGVSFWYLGGEDPLAWSVIDIVTNQPAGSVLGSLNIGTATSGTWGIFQVFANGQSDTLLQIKWGDETIQAMANEADGRMNCALMVILSDAQGNQYKNIEITNPSQTIDLGALPAGNWLMKVSTSCAASQPFVAATVLQNGSSLYSILLPVALSRYSYSPVPQTPPVIPSDPIPANNAIDQSLSINLNWYSKDPDGDRVTYDVYIGKDDDTPGLLVCDDVSVPSCFVEGLLDGEKYYWRVEVTDQTSLSSSGPIWDFTTKSYSNVTYKINILTQGEGLVLLNPNKPSYYPGEEVELTAVPDVGWRFLGWTGDLTGNTNPITVVISNDMVVTAIFGKSDGISGTLY